MYILVCKQFFKGLNYIVNFVLLYVNFYITIKIMNEIFHMSISMACPSVLYKYTPTKVKHHPIFLSIYFFTSILLKQ